jgi:copper homeostasis protein
MQKPLLEIAVFSVEAAITANAAGADRIEFCENPPEGGTTPSYGSLVSLSKRKICPVFPIIRPRGGDFLYTDAEYESMQADVLIAKQLGYPGVVIGLLKADGAIDIERTKALVDLAAPMEVTFHRAFDRCNDPFKGLEDIIETGCKRILTSGQVPNAMNGLTLLSQLVNQAKGRIIIMPGSGVRANNIEEMLQVTGANEIHSSARKMYPSKMEYVKVSMNEEMKFTGVDVDEIHQMRANIQKTS